MDNNSTSEVKKGEPNKPNPLTAKIESEELYTLYICGLTFKNMKKEGELRGITSYVSPAGDVILVLSKAKDFIGQFFAPETLENGSVLAASGTIHPQLQAASRGTADTLSEHDEV